MNKWKQEGQLKKYSSGSSVITHTIKSQEGFLHFTSHLAFSHIMTEIWALFATSVDSSTSAATNGAALISFTSYLTTSPIAAIKSFWIIFQKPENTVDVSKWGFLVDFHVTKSCCSPHIFVASFPNVTCRSRQWCHITMIELPMSWQWNAFIEAEILAASLRRLTTEAACLTSYWCDIALHIQYIMHNVK